MVPAGFEELTHSFEELITRVESVDVRVPEDSALIGLAADLVPKVTHQLRDGIALMLAIERYYDPSKTNIPRPDDADTLHHIGILISSEFAARDLTDVAYFARLELKGALEKLEQSATRGKRGDLLLASNCEAGLRCLRKALVSVESAVYEFEESRAPARSWFDVELSLQIRKLYWNLRNETELAAAEDEEDLEGRLRQVLYRIMAFRELSVYPFLRVEDRVHMRTLLKRILEWLNSEDRDSDVAKRLWSDLTSFTEILVQISQRQELQDHDRDLLRFTYNRLFRKRGLAEVTPALLDDLDSVLGLDEELDDLIANRITYKEAWREPLETLLKRLEKSPEPAARVDLLGPLEKEFDPRQGSESELGGQD